MQKNNNKNKVDKYTAKMRIIGGIICLVALITVFVVGLFVGKSINKNDNISSNNDITLTADTDYVLNGTYVFNDTLDLSSFATTNYGEEYFELWFECDTNGDGVLEEYNVFWIESNYNQTEKYFGYSYDLDKNFQLYVWDKFGNSFYSSSVSSARTIYIDNYTYSDNLTFYNWFIANTTVVVPSSDYTMSFDLSSGVFYDVLYVNLDDIDNSSVIDIKNNVSSLTVSADNTYRLQILVAKQFEYGTSDFLKFGYFMTATLTNCDFTITKYERFINIDITNITGDISVVANNNDIPSNYTKINITGTALLYFVNIPDSDNYFVVDIPNTYECYVIPFGYDVIYSFDMNITWNYDTSVLNSSVSSSDDVVIELVSREHYYDVYSIDIPLSDNNLVINVNYNAFNNSGDIGGDIDVSFVDWLVNAAGAFFNFQIMPNLSLGLILGTILILAVIVWVLKVFMGG